MKKINISGRSSKVICGRNKGVINWKFREVVIYKGTEKGVDKVGALQSFQNNDKILLSKQGNMYYSLYILSISYKHFISIIICLVFGNNNK